jgi:hypothetical protein
MQTIIYYLRQESLVTVLFSIGMSPCTEHPVELQCAVMPAALHASSVGHNAATSMLRWYTHMCANDVHSSEL